MSGDEYTGYTGQMALDQSVLAKLGKDRKRLAETAKELSKNLIPPGHISKDRATGYMSKIRTLFSDESEEKIHLALAAWCILNDVGGTQDFSAKNPIVVGNTTVKATQVFGDIIPVSNEGLPRQFAATMFEKDIDVVIDAFPELRAMLSARAASAGMPNTNPALLVSFVKGVTTATAGAASVRHAAKVHLLRENTASVGVGGAKREAAMAADIPMVQEIVPPPSGHNLY